jgi:sugar diacid utilization regulator
VSRLAADAGVAVASQHELAEAIFAYIDQLAAESVEGYADAQAADAGSLQRRREELLMMLLAQPAPTRRDLEEAAADAGWPLPRRVAVATAAPEAVARVARGLSGDVLHGIEDRHGYVVVPEPAGLNAELSVAARRYAVAIGLGPTVALPDAGQSARWAALARRGVSEGTVGEAEARLADLVLEASPDIMVALRDQALAPLEEETPASRVRLEATLRAWLRHHGAQAAIAAELGVHPQTVRYRMARLRELFGRDIEDPDKRFALSLALHADKSLEPGSDQRSGGG